MVCTLANDFMTPSVIRGDEGTITLRKVMWESGCEAISVTPPRGREPEVIAGSKSDSTRDHWLDFLRCVHTRGRPVADVEFGYHVQGALCTGMLAYKEREIARYDKPKQELVLVCPGRQMRP
jgi:hypothetical protein